ncbi:DUF523 domain-containing protein [Enterococcus sp. DIV1298c]|uniref:DUF523 domain-containing protein n=1 Tax=Candidatus Enterococcus mangumiae TaxID=2230878 RepID=A0ABZ2T5D2_9ENTE|nr:MULTISPECIES: DUF523 domain-containing protein [unclassified Enterococcus]MBO0462619.1 DUF523 domain-containing protein [Enterococcus sp. DIV1298c]MBO0489963.1 DUF523 domain-containing protein [Enterococcus sp. DIV1094]
MIGISACLGGVLCRYDGRDKAIPALKKLVAEGQAIMICPEVAGGLPIPREPAEIVGGDGFDVWHQRAKVLTVSGEDVTEVYKSGAIKAYQRLKEKQISTLILKANSPSCGSTSIYDGTFSGTLKEGTGVATAYFLQQKISVCSEEEWMDQRGELNGN